MNTIIEALQNAVGDIRITYSDRWLFWNSDYKMWQVNERLPYAKKTTIVICTSNEQTAVYALLGDDNG